MLNFREYEVWKMTPRKLMYLWDEYKKYYGLKSKKREEDKYIDEIAWL